MQGRTSEKVMRDLIFLFWLANGRGGVGSDEPMWLEDEEESADAVAATGAVLFDSKNPIKRHVVFDGTTILRTVRFSSADAGRLRNRLTAVTLSGSGLSLRMDRRRFSTGGVP